MKLFCALLPLFVLSLSSSLIWAADELSSDDFLTFCHFGPKIKNLDSVQESDGCTGTAKIQALMWDCVMPDGVESAVTAFRKKLTDTAAAECSRVCTSRAKGCEGRFERPYRCGLGMDREDGVEMGKRQGCRKKCGGPAFAYCSLYDAGFRTDDPERVAKQAPNCRCRWGKSKR